MSGLRRPNIAVRPKSCGPDDTFEKILGIKHATCDHARMCRTRPERGRTQREDARQWRGERRAALRLTSIARLARARPWRWSGARDPVHRTPSGLGADRDPCGCRTAMAD